MRGALHSRGAKRQGHLSRLFRRGNADRSAKGVRMRKLALAAALLVVVVLPASSGGHSLALEFRPLDGSGNNVAHPSWGAAGRRQTPPSPPLHTADDRENAAG